MRWWRRTRPDNDSTDTGSGGGRVPFPRPTQRELTEDWIRGLTLVLSAEPGTTPDQVLNRIREVNQPRTVTGTLHTPLTAEDRATLDDATAWHTEVRSREAGLHLLIEGWLIGQLAEATGQHHSTILQRLALHLETLLPPP